MFIIQGGTTMTHIAYCATCKQKLMVSDKQTKWVTITGQDHKEINPTHEVVIGQLLKKK